MADADHPEVDQLKQTIAALETQRAILGDAIIDTALAPLREKLATLEQTLPEQQRKQATVLFADVKGFTAMSEKLDAEDLTDLMNALWERLDAAITNYGGRIDKHIGDSVMALWGSERGREDDPENAIRAALAMQATLAGFRKERGVELGMRIGVNSGPVLVGAVGSTREFTAMGDTVNIASRLEGAAPVDGILIGVDTCRLVRGIFDLQALEPIRVKGKAEPLQVYRVLEAKPRAFRMGTRGVAGVETRMVGREAELGWLQAGLRGVMATGRLQMLTLLGEAGVGKSRLLFEFGNWIDRLEEPVRYFKGRAFAQEQSRPYALLRDLFAARFQVGENEPLAAVWQKLEAGFGEALAGDEQHQMKAHFVGQLLGYDLSASPHLAGVLTDARQIHDRALQYIIAYFRSASVRNTVAILLEDMHWADEASLDILEYLGRALQACPIFILGLTRPELLERRPEWGQGQPYQARLVLHPLAEAASRQLLEDILKKAGETPPELVRLVVQAAEGNPFYIEELVKMLMDEGVIQAGDERWQIDLQRLAGVHVPLTLTGVLQARLDRLTSEERITLQQASVVGRVFWEKLVAALGETELQRVAVELQRLQGREMVFQRGQSEFQDTREYIFKHALLRDVTYESVLKRVRRRYHELAARWLIEQGGERQGEYLGLIGEHLERAGLASEAVGYLRRAGESAAAAYANADAAVFFSQALALLPEGDRQGRWELLLLREAIYDRVGPRVAQLADLQALQLLAGEANNPAWLAKTALRQANYARTTNDVAGISTSATIAITAARQAQDLALEAEGQYWAGLASVYQEIDSAAEHGKEVLRLARICGRADLEAEGLNLFGDIARRQGNHARSKDCVEQALAISRSIGDRGLECRFIRNLGNNASWKGEFIQASGYYQQALVASREMGARSTEETILYLLGWVAANKWEYCQARNYLEASLTIERELGYLSTETLSTLGIVTARLGNFRLAREYVEQDLVFQHEADMEFENYDLSLLARICAEQGDLEAAAGYTEQILRFKRDEMNQYEICNYLAYALVAVGKPEEAVPVLRLSVELYDGENYIRGEQLDARATLARAYLALGRKAAALAQVETVLNYLEGGKIFYGSDGPAEVYLTCYQVLSAYNDPRAAQVLQAGYDLLQQIAAKIPDDAERRAFLEKVPSHREVLALWQRRGV